VQRTFDRGLSDEGRQRWGVSARVGTLVLQVGCWPTRPEKPIDNLGLDVDAAARRYQSNRTVRSALELARAFVASHWDSRHL